MSPLNPRRSNYCKTNQSNTKENFARYTNVFNEKKMLTSKNSINSSDANKTNISFSHPIYFGLLLKYFDIKFIFSTIVILSKYHLDFMNDNKNKKLIQRLISSQIGTIFEISPSFEQYYLNPTTNPYTLISKFYTDFGYIEEMAFPEHHKYIIKHCKSWKEETDDIDWENAEIIDEEGLGYHNPWDFQYNAIKYDKIPFDMAILCKLQKSECIIHILKALQKRIKFMSDFYNVYLSEPPYIDEIEWREVMLITAINDDKANELQSFYDVLMDNICYWPSNEFRKMIQFILKNVNIESMGFAFLCREIIKFWEVKNKSVGCENYCIYLDEMSKYRTIQDGEAMDIIHEYLDHPFLFGWNNLYDRLIDIIWREHNESMDLLQTARDDVYLQRIFGRIGEYLRDNLNKKDLTDYLENVENNSHHLQLTIYIDLKKYHQLFLEFLGFT